MDKLTFLAYEEARQSGEFNMIMDAHSVMAQYGISSDDYWDIIKNYSKYANQFLKS